MREEWLLTLPLEATTLASAEHFSIPKSSTPEADWVVARSDTFDKILMWEEGMPEGSLRREFTFKGDEVTLITMMYGCSKAKSVVGVGDVASIIVRYRNDSFLSRITNPLLCKDIIMRVDRLSNPLKLVNAGSFLYIFHFYRRESEDPDSLCNYFDFSKPIAPQHTQNILPSIPLAQANQSIDFAPIRGRSEEAEPAFDVSHRCGKKRLNGGIFRFLVDISKVPFCNDFQKFFAAKGGHSIFFNFFLGYPPLRT